MARYVTVKYTFDAQAEGELSVNETDILELIDDSVGSGWWKLKDKNGITGLVPIDFVELSMPENYSCRECTEGWEWEDTESDDNLTSNQNQSFSRQQNIFANSSIVQHPAAEMAKVAIIRKVFKTSGGEEYFLSDRTFDSLSKAKINLADGAWVWAMENPSFTCEIENFQKDNKFKGIKSFILYSLRPSFDSRQVHRRYKHFFWLHCMLENKFPCVTIPPLPDKTISNRYEPEFITQRQKLLQRWLDRICKHPVLSQCSVIQHFMTCSNDKKWKVGKRDAENDKLQGGRFFLAISSPESWTSLDVINPDLIERNIQMNEKSTKHLIDQLSDHEKHIRTDLVRDFNGISSYCLEICQTLAKDPSRYQKSTILKTSMENLNFTYKSLAQAHADQNNFFQTDALLDLLREFEGIYNNMHKLSALAKSTSQLLEDGNKAVTEDKLAPIDNEKLREKAAVIGRSILAELHFYSETKCLEWAKGFQDYLEEKADFYQRISGMYSSAAQSFKDILNN